MKRIVILGCAGTGKSTLAKRLGDRLSIPVVHLDAIRWQPGWTPVTIDELRARLLEAISGDAWITDGNYATCTFDLRLPRADVVIWLERPLIDCYWRVFRRAFRSHFIASERLADLCTEYFDRRFLERLKFIAGFNRINRPRIEAMRKLHGPTVPVIVLRSGRETSAFLDSLAHLD
jgi:adenylate kinase family enzyme